MSNNDLYCSKCKSHHHPVECPKMTRPPEDKEIIKVKGLTSARRLWSEGFNQSNERWRQWVKDAEIDEKIYNFLENMIRKHKIIDKYTSYELATAIRKLLLEGEK